MNHGSTKHQLVSGVLWMTVVRALSQSITWIITIVVVRLLTPHDYGLMGMATLVSGFLALFSEIGLGVAIIQRPNLRDDQLSNLSWVIFSVHGLFFAVLVVFAPAIAAYFGEPRLVDVVRVMATGFILQGIGAPSSFLLQRRMAFRDKALSELVGNVSGGISTLIAAVGGAGVWSLVVGYIVQQLVTNALYCVRAPFPLRLSFSTRGLRDYVGFGGQVATARVLWYISSNADFAIVGRLLGSVQLGFYGMAFQFSSIPLDRLVAIVTQVAFPTFSSLQHDDDRLRRYYVKLTSTVALVTFPMLIGLALIADAAVPLLLTSKWTPIVVPLQILCVVSCFRAVEMLCHPLVVAKGRPQVSLWNSLLQAVVLPIAFILGVLYGGLQGIAVAWLVTRPFIFLFVTTLTLRTIQLPFLAYLNALRHPIAGCLVMALAVVTTRHMLLHAPLVVTVALACSSGALLYGGYQFLFNSEMVKEAFQLVRKRRASSSSPTGDSSEATATS
jgi:O-antigen/teichoic acid export membrane protein